MRMKAFIATAVAAMASLLVSNTAALADLSIHESTELFHPVGGSGFAGTSVTCAIGCGPNATTFSVGDTSVPFSWKIFEQAEHDHAAGTTSISYTIGNSSLAAGLTSFRIPDRGQVPIAVATPPTGWTFSQGGGFFGWSTTGSGLPMGIATLDSFIVTFAGIQDIVFDFPAGRDVGNGPVVFHDEWIVSSIPLPGAWVLGAIGLAGVGWLKQRFA